MPDSLSRPTRAILLRRADPCRQDAGVPHGAADTPRARYLDSLQHHEASRPDRTDHRQRTSGPSPAASESSARVRSWPASRAAKRFYGIGGDDDARERPGGSGVSPVFQMLGGSRRVRRACMPWESDPLSCLPRAGAGHVRVVQPWLGTLWDNRDSHHGERRVRPGVLQRYGALAREVEGDLMQLAGGSIGGRSLDTTKKRGWRVVA